MTHEPSQNHNDAMPPILRLIVDHAQTEAGQWVILESLCLGVGKLHGRTAKEIALYVETIAERLTTGERA